MVTREQEIERQVSEMREALLAEHRSEQHAAAVKAAEAARRDQVRVRWLKDAPGEGLAVNGYVARGRGPVVQRRAGGVDVVVEPAEESTVPRVVAEILVRAGYVAILRSATKQETTDVVNPPLTAEQEQARKLQQTEAAERRSRLRPREGVQIRWSTHSGIQGEVYVDARAYRPYPGALDLVPRSDASALVSGGLAEYAVDAAATEQGPEPESASPDAPALAEALRKGAIVREAYERGEQARRAQVAQQLADLEQGREDEERRQAKAERLRQDV